MVTGTPEQNTREAPGIRREWVEAYLQGVARTRGAKVARESARQLGLFLRYAARRAAPDAARLPWWEYSVALEWIGAHTRGFHLSLERARRLLDTLGDFFGTLVRAGHLSHCWDVEHARAVLCGGDRLRLLRRPPYTGTEAWAALRPLNGRLVTFSIADFWLSLLWKHCGSSWAALEERVRQAPGASGKLAAVADLRARLADAHCPDPLRLLPNPTTAATVEDALRWLSTPGPHAPDVALGVPEPEMMRLATTSLVERLAVASPHMPRREMQELLRRGEAILPDLLAVLRANPSGDPLWAIVVLGELRHPDAIAGLIPFLGTPDDALAEASAEALGKLGAPAVPRLASTALRAEGTERLYAYSALGMIHTDDAYRCLLAALVRDPGLGDVVARALAEHGRRDAIEPLFASHVRAPDWMRSDFECAIASLVHGPRPLDPTGRDWRVRYRRLPRLGWRFPPSWVTVAARAHVSRHDGEVAPTRRSGSRSLAAIIADTRLQGDGRVCVACGGRVWQPTGLPLCRHTAQQLIALQRAAIARWLAAGLRDVWAALDACDAADLQHIHAAQAGRAGQRAEHEREMIAVARATLYSEAWRTDLRTTSQYLQRVANDFAILYGDPPNLS